MNEAFLRLVETQHVHWQNRAHFFAMSARLMRRSVFERYNIVSDGDLREAAQKLSATVTGTISGTVTLRAASAGSKRTPQLVDIGGGRGIRTPGTLPGTAVFKTAAIDHSAIPPRRRCTRQTVHSFVIVLPESRCSVRAQLTPTS